MMRNIVTVVLSVAVAAAMVLGIGCAAMSEYVTPATIDGRAIEYVVDAGLADANDYDGYANLYKARKLQIQVAAAHEVNLLELEQMIEQENLDANILRGIMERSVAEATALEEAIFDPTTGLLAAGLGVLGISAGGVIGLMRKRHKRPGDYTEAEMTAALADLKGQLNERDHQFIEVVRSVQQFKDSAKTSNDPVLVKGAEMLSTFLRTHTKSTQNAVSAAKHA